MKSSVFALIICPAISSVTMFPAPNCFHCHLNLRMQWFNCKIFSSGASLPIVWCHILFFRLVFCYPNWFIKDFARCWNDTCQTWWHLCYKNKIKKLMTFIDRSSCRPLQRAFIHVFHACMHPSSHGCLVAPFKFTPSEGPLHAHPLHLGPFQHTYHHALEWVHVALID